MPLDLPVDVPSQPRGPPGVSHVSGPEPSAEGGGRDPLDRQSGAYRPANEQRAADQSRKRRHENEGNPVTPDLQATLYDSLRDAHYTAPASFSSANRSGG